MTPGRALLLLALCGAAGPGFGQSLVYVEPGNAACPAVPEGADAVPRTVRRGVAVPGSLRVACGFDNGSYTVTLRSTDAGATFSPTSFLVNFGRLAGNGAFTVTFATPGVHGVSATITSNMGSPAVRGRFASADARFDVVPP